MLSVNRFPRNRCLPKYPRYQFQSTKSPELIFSALVDDDGGRIVRFERTLDIPKNSRDVTRTLEGAPGTHLEGVSEGS